MLLKIVLALALFIHGVLHLLGYKQMRTDGTMLKGRSIIWYFTAGLLLATSLLLLLNASYWWLSGCAAILISQLLILGNWSHARWGTIINIFLLAAITYLLV